MLALMPDLGTGFIRELGRQQITFLQDRRQQLEWLGRGRYPLCIGCSDSLAREFVNEGVPMAPLAPTQLKEGGRVTPGTGTLALMNRAPHPNAAKVYANWLLSREGQTHFVRAVELASRRVDVPTDHLESWRLPKEGYVPVYTKDAEDVRRQLAPVLREVFGL
jgi:iron(III) transport system substrate-binding protein